MNSIAYWTRYWTTVVRCIARPDGATEIWHENGKIERFDANGRTISPGGPATLVTKNRKNT